MENGNLIIEDNGVGMSQKEFETVSTQYATKEEATGLGLNICVAILKEHGFIMSCEKLNTGTKITINLNKTT